MPFPNIIPLRQARVEPVKYFVDANVWIYSPQGFNNLVRWENDYYQFFFDIVESTLSPKPKILLPTLLLSEIINTFLKKIAIPAYKVANNILPATVIDFKRDYRPTQHYKDSYEQMMDDISVLHASIDFIDDRSIAHNPAVLYNRNTGTFDYNDFLYYSLCADLNKSERVIMVTNDGDFQVNDLEIITSNRTLLSLS